MSIKYVIGDATDPIGDESKLIAHVVNDLGLWGAGFVVPLGNKYPNVKTSYQEWAHGTDEWFGLGEVQVVQATDDIYVANMVAQRGVRNFEYLRPLQYDALDECIWKLSYLAADLNASIHMPRIGCGLAGGSWSRVEEILNEELSDNDVTIYDLN